MSSLIRGQAVEPVKAARARELRREMTPTETRLWQRLRAHRLNGLHFRRQQVIAGFIVDFFCSAARLVVEVDGGVHDGQREADAEREAVLTGHGLRVLRLANDEVNANLEQALARVRSACGGEA